MCGGKKPFEHHMTVLQEHSLGGNTGTRGETDFRNGMAQRIWGHVEKVYLCALQGDVQI